MQELLDCAWGHKDFWAYCAVRLLLCLCQALQYSWPEFGHCRRHAQCSQCGTCDGQERLVLSWESIKLAMGFTEKPTYGHFLDPNSNMLAWEWLFVLAGASELLLFKNLLGIGRKLRARRVKKDLWGFEGLSMVLRPSPVVVPSVKNHGFMVLKNLML